MRERSVELLRQLDRQVLPARSAVCLHQREEGDARRHGAWRTDHYGAARLVGLRPPRHAGQSGGVVEQLHALGKVQ